MSGERCGGSGLQREPRKSSHPSATGLSFAPKITRFSVRTPPKNPLTALVSGKKRLFLAVVPFPSHPKRVPGAKFLLVLPGASTTLKKGVHPRSLSRNQFVWVVSRVEGISKNGHAHKASHVENSKGRLLKVLVHPTPNSWYK